MRQKYSVSGYKFTILDPALGLLALGALTRNVRSLWQLHHAGRGSYPQLALLVASTLLLFVAVDLPILV